MIMTDSLLRVRNSLHAQLCYQFFITPIPMPLEKKYRDFAKMACEFLEIKRTEVLHQNLPRHYVIHRFAQEKNPQAKKILITHGWMSRAAYMAVLINDLHRSGYDVYALDFPAHGDAKGYQLPWTDAVTIIKDVLNQQGPFHGVIGHSFGGSMLLNTLNLSGQVPNLQLGHKPEKAILIASPTHMRGPIADIARRFKLNGYAYLQLRHLIAQKAEIDLSLIRLNHFITQQPNTPFLCIHGEQDATVMPSESISFCQQYKNADLALLKDADHISILMDKRVGELIINFLNN